MTKTSMQLRQERFLTKVSEKAARELAEELECLRSRPDWRPGYDYFLDLMENGLTSSAAARRTGKSVINLLCLQAPMELIHAAGLHPFKIFGGSTAAAALAAHELPALMCPMMRSLLGSIQMQAQDAVEAWVMPTTCDWVVNVQKALNIIGLHLDAPQHWLELPHFKDSPGSQNHWLDEIFGLKKFLEKLTGKKINRTSFINSISLYHNAWCALHLLSIARQQGRLANLWFMLICNSFFLDDVEKWTESLEKILADLNSQLPKDNAPPEPCGAGDIPPARKISHPLIEEGRGAKVYLAGSPIFFPNFKLPHLLEEAGLSVVNDDLCSSGRLMPGAVTYSDTSIYGLMEALAQRYHQGCLCPTFADNDRRINNILGQLQTNAFEGVVFQILKGCHPYDLESFTVERKLKEHGLKFIRLETDYTAEDSRNLLTRLEAFRQTLGGIIK